MPRAIVVVPCYNEAQRLNVRAIQDFGRRTDTVQLLFVNDGSRDETLALIQHLHFNNPRRFQFLHLAVNGGKAEAVRQGILTALGDAPDYVGFWDADLATPLIDIEAFCRVLETKPKIDLVMGSRMCLLGHKIERRRSRYWLGRLFATAASMVLGLRVFDTQCGAKLFRVTPELRRLFAQRFLTRWIFDVEIIARMQSARRGSVGAPLSEAIYEFPLDAWRDVAGSTLKSSDFLKAIVELGRIYLTRWRPLPLPVEPAIAADSQPGVTSRPEQQQAA